MKFSAEQQAVLDHQGSAVVTGPAGCGKTTLLIEKAKHLVAGGMPAQQVYVVGFAWRSIKLLERMMSKRAASIASDIRYGTIRDFALKELEETEEQTLAFADNAKMRRLLKKAIQEEKFVGSVSEAEHIVRSFKARSRKPQENERHFGLLNAYKNLLEHESLLDRHDIVRKHIIGMRNDTAQPCAAKVMLVDNVQDATQIQLLWLQEHLRAGVEMIFFGNDDLTVFGLDGAQGHLALEQLAELPNVAELKLGDIYRTPTALLPSVAKVARLLPIRLDKKEHPLNAQKAAMVVKKLPDMKQEMAFMVDYITQAQQHGNDRRVGIIVRDDYQANMLVHVLQKNGINPASYARPLWENYGAEIMINMLQIILNQATDGQLRQVLVGFGLNQIMVDTFFREGLVARDWLPRGGMLPETVNLPGDSLREYSALRRRLMGYWQLLSQKETDARSVFKAAAHDLLVHLNQDDKEDALLALDILLSLKGRLSEKLAHIKTEKLPDMSSNVVVAPVREVRNMEFDQLLMPQINQNRWPSAEYKVIDMDMNHERRLFYLAVSRAKGDITFTHTEDLSTFVVEMQSAQRLKKQRQAG